ncbi:hypothetical protein SAMN05661093_10966 [Kibdelosporangium aridum]|uniref:Integrase n=1 Tax=Kibdelosporangium aridum TaxID=2030 RepID=A0A1Y5Y962_KIBAR|nr:hypothetical protein SAMN05661093_10966 [Kibdelosporangium aridum]
MLLRLAYLGLTNTFTLLRLLPTTDRNKDIEILVLRHQIAVLQRQLGGARVRFSPADRALFAALLHRLPHRTLHRLCLLVRPDTILRWHRDLLRRRHAEMSRPKRPGRPRTIRSIRVLVLRLTKENPNWGYRRIHGELLVLGIKVAASTVWQILTDAGVDPAPERASSTWAQFLRSQADALLACDFLETVTLTGARMYVLQTAGLIYAGVSRFLLCKSFVDHWSCAGHGVESPRLALVGARIYLPEEQLTDPVRRAALDIPDTVTFRTKPELAQDILAEAIAEQTRSATAGVAGRGVESSLARAPVVECQPARRGDAVLLPPPRRELGAIPSLPPTGTSRTRPWRRTASWPEASARRFSTCRTRTPRRWCPRW